VLKSIIRTIRVLKEHGVKFGRASLRKFVSTRHFYHGQDIDIKVLFKTILLIGCLILKHYTVA
jgi:hypothetical protein